MSVTIACRKRFARKLFGVRSEVDLEVNYDDWREGRWHEAPIQNILAELRSWEDETGEYRGVLHGLERSKGVKVVPIPDHWLLAFARR